MTGELWWNRLVNSVRFLDDVGDALMDDRSVMLIFGSEIPWRDIMTDTLEQKLLDANSSRAFDILDVSDFRLARNKDKPQKGENVSAGEYLMEEYCSREQRNIYWPPTHGSPERFLAQYAVTPLNKRYVCMTGMKREHAAKWAACVSEYLENCGDPHDHGVFILIAEDKAAVPLKNLTVFRYDDYVTDYDCMMLCLTLVSDMSCGRAEKMYLCEAASNIAHNHVEHAALFVSERSELIRDSVAAVERVCRENDIHIPDLRETVRMALWEAQIKLVFPKLENFRAGLIRKYDEKLQVFLPIRSSNNDRIEKASDLEIGQLFHIFSTYRIIESAEYDMLSKMREARNTLAHWEPLPYSKLKEIGII